VSELDAQAHHVWHPWLRVQRLIRSITQERWDREARTVMKVTLKDALKGREKIRRAGWSAVQMASWAALSYRRPNQNSRLRSFCCQPEFIPSLGSSHPTT